MTETEIIIPVTGMTCSNCAIAIERALRKTEGVLRADVNFAAENVTVAFDTGRVNTEKVIAQIKKAALDRRKETQPPEI